MANAYTALSNDISGFVYNPASVATRPRNAISCGYVYNRPSVKLKNVPAGSKHSGFREELKMPTAGFVIDLQWIFTPINRWVNRLTFIPERVRPDLSAVFGMTVGIPDNFKQFIGADTHYPDELQFPVFGTVQDFLLVGGGMGFRLHDKVYLGASIRSAFTADLHGLVVDIETGKMDTSVPLDDLTDDSGIEIGRLNVNAETEFMPIFGILILPRENVRLGATWRSGGGMVNFHGTLGLHFLFGPVRVAIPATPSVFEWYFPEETSVGLAVKPVKDLWLCLEATYARWSKYDLPMLVPPPGDPFRDIVITRIGLEYRVTGDLKARCGYYYQPSAVRTVQAYTQHMDTDEHVFSVGLGYLCSPLERFLGNAPELDLSFQYQGLTRRTLETFRGPVTIRGHHAGLAVTLEVPF